MTAHTPGHGLPTTTHTLEMAQIAELNARLTNTRSPVITAGDLQMVADHGAGSEVPADAVLSRVSWQGSPEFPEIHGHFGAAGSERSANLHTAALQQISRRLLLRQRWGV